jgi:Flp pilus assembly protein TadD
MFACGSSTPEPKAPPPPKETAKKEAPAAAKPAAVAVAAAATAKPERTPVNDKALRAFDGGLRALKLGGSEMNQQAATRFADAVAADDNLWEAWHDLGVVRARLGDDRAAMVAFSKVLEKKSDYTPSRLGRAEAARRLRRWRDAQADYNAILEKEPDELTPRLRFASLLRENGDTDGSLKQVREVLRRNPQGKDLASANIELGMVYLAAGRHELADLVLTKAAQTDPQNPRVWNALAILSLKRGRDQEAFVRLDKATTVDPTFRDARYNKAAVLLDAGDYSGAKSELDVAAKGDDDLDALVALGVAQRGLGDVDKARNVWERVLKQAPAHPDALYNLGVLHMEFQRDENKARDYLNRFVDAASDDHPRKKDAQARLSQLTPKAAPAPAPAKPAPKPQPPKKGK